MKQFVLNHRAVFGMLMGGAIAVSLSGDLALPLLAAEPPPTAETLEQLLEQRNAHLEAAEAIDQEIWQIFGKTQAVMMIDMAGFSRTAAELGIVPTLAMIQRQRSVAVPVIRQHGGQMLKADADNVLAVFPDVDQAVAAAAEILQTLVAKGQGASIGIGYGETLAIAAEDVYGEEVNLASKLGEDLALRNEILLTEMAYQRWQPRPAQARLWKRDELEIAGLELTVHRWQPTQPAAQP